MGRFGDTGTDGKHQVAFSYSNHTWMHSALLEHELNARLSEPPGQKKLVHLRHLNWIFPGSISLLAFLLLANSLQGRFPFQFVDSAGMADLIDSHIPNWTLASSYLDSFNQGFTALVGLPLTEACLQATSVAPGQRSIMPFHPYLVAIPLSGLSGLTGLSGVMVATYGIAFSVVGGLLAIYVFLVKRRTPLFVVLLFLLLVVTWPVLSQGLLGQLYFDRLFFLPGIALVFMVWISAHSRKSWSTPLAVVAVLVGSLISERGALISGAVAATYAISSIRRNSGNYRRLLPIAVAGILAIAWATIWALTVQESNYYSAFTLAALQDNLLRLAGDYYAPKFLIFLTALLPFLILTVLAPRGLPTFLAVTIPNLLWTVGGAELSGFATHYHQMYLPVVVALSAIGISTSIGKISGKHLSVTRITFAFTAFVVLTLLTWTLLLPSTSKPQALFSDAWSAFRDPGSLVSEEQAQVRNEIRRTLEGDSALSVSASEEFAPLIYESGVRNFEYFPASVGKADILVLHYPEGSEVPQLYPLGQPSWVPEGLDLCIQVIVDRKYVTIKEFKRDTDLIRIFTKR